MKNMILAIASALALGAAVISVPKLAPKAVMMDKSVTVTEARIFMARPKAPSAAAYVVLSNGTGDDLRLVGAEFGPARNVMLHTTETDANGVTKMVHLMGGIDLPAGGQAILERGGMHIMLMGLDGVDIGQSHELTLLFDGHAPMTITATVDGP